MGIERAFYFISKRRVLLLPNFFADTALFVISKRWAP
jgi:hypothetical protein